MILAGILAGGLGTAVLAQDDPPASATPGLTRSNVLRQALARFPGSDIIAFNGEFAPGAMPGRHRHPGPEIFHVIEGHGILLQDGREPVELGPGTTVVSEPPEDAATFTHEVRNLSKTEPLKTYVVLLVPEGQPPSLPAD